jgi:hypothetical protein
MRSDTNYPARVRNPALKPLLLTHPITLSDESRGAIRSEQIRRSAS